MIANLKPYPTMKDSGVEWLGEVPEHWALERAKNLFTKVERPTQETDEVVTCFRDGTVTLRKNRRTQGFTESLKEIGYQGIRAGDLVIHAMDAFAGAVGVSDSDGKGTPVYAVCEPKPHADAHYHAFVIREMARSQWILALATGIRERSTDFRFGTYAIQRVPLPPLPEQAAIVQYLDHVDRRVRRLIRAKRKLIALLTEQKQAIIHQAVTRGLDPDVSLKDSGVEWLGEVPTHWEVVPLKRAFISMDYGISDSGTDDGTIPVLTMGHIRDGSVTVPKNGGVTTVDPSLLLQDKDLLFNRTNSADLVAKVGLFRSDERPITFASYLVRMRSRQANKPEFLNLLLNDVGFLAAARREAIPSLHQSNLNPTRYGRLPIPLPPTQEQHAIIESVAERTSDLDAAISRATRETELLNEYRTRLIADVVTGKLDAREAATKLPDEPADADTLDETDDLTADEEDTEEDLDAVLEEADA